MEDSFQGRTRCPECRGLVTLIGKTYYTVGPDGTEADDLRRRLQGAEERIERLKREIREYIFDIEDRGEQKNGKGK